MRCSGATQHSVEAAPLPCQHSKTGALLIRVDQLSRACSPTQHRFPFWQPSHARERAQCSAQPNTCPSQCTFGAGNVHCRAASAATLRPGTAPCSVVMVGFSPAVVGSAPLLLAATQCTSTPTCRTAAITVQYSNCGRGSQTSALASEPRAHEGARRPAAYPSLSGQVWGRSKSPASQPSILVKKTCLDVTVG
jgi:hypothetical protein